MKARELRIGNIIEYAIGDTFNDREPYFGKCIFQVVMIMDDSIKIDIGYDATLRVLFDDPKLKSVKLTDEWLVKFGFKIHGRRISRDWFYLWYDDEKIVFALAEMQEETGAYLVIKNVHQLQNLYFALTGEELTIEHAKTSNPIN